MTESSDSTATSESRESAKIAFVFCVESGWLEAQARLLVGSIRTFAGRFARSPIYAVQPRGGPTLAKETTECFTEAGVIHRVGTWNDEHSELPTCNKVYAMALVERETNADCVAFLDTDTVILGEPALFDLNDDYDLALQITARGLGGTAGPGDRENQYWQTVFQACSIVEGPDINTVNPVPSYRGYYNGGLVVARRNCLLGERWLEFLRRIDPLTQEKRHFLDQYSLAAVAASVPGRVRQLPPSYNYNIRRRGEFPSDLRSIDLGELIHVHYHNSFSRPGFLAKAWPALNPRSVQFLWLSERLPLSPVQKPSRRRYYIYRRTRLKLSRLVHRLAAIHRRLLTFRDNS